LLPEAALSRRILTLAGPVVFAMLTQTFVNITDTLMVGKLDPTVSVPGQAALGFSLPLLWSVGGFLSSISVGTQSMTARRQGEGESELAGRVLANSLLVAFTTGGVASVVAYFLVPWAFTLLTADPAVQVLGAEYAGWRMLGVLSMVATASYKSFFDGIGKTHVHLVAAMIMNVLNVGLNYALIFGWWVFPAMGVGGAGLASLISTYVGLGVMIGWSLWPALMRSFRVYRLANIQPRMGWEIVKLSVPSGLATVFVMAGFLVYFKIIGLLDADAVTESLAATGFYGQEGASAYRVWQDGWLEQSRAEGASAVTDWAYMALASRPAVYSAAAKVITDIFSVMFISSLAFGTATATLVSQSLGEGRPDMAERYGWSSAKLGAWILVVVAALVVAWPEATLDLLSDDPAVIAVGAPALRLLACFGPMVMMAFVWTQALFGAGNTKYVMYVELVLHFFCLVPGTWLFVFGLDLGFIGAWMAVGTYIVALFAAMGWKFWEGKWKAIQV
jgi:Na+-driven multidrug efflux pump